MNHLFHVDDVIFKLRTFRSSNLLANILKQNQHKTSTERFKNINSKVKIATHTHGVP